MRQRSRGRASTAAALAVTLALATPLAAMARGWEGGSGRPATESWSLLDQAWQWLAGWWGTGGVRGSDRVGAAGEGEEGSWIDPDGVTARGGEGSGTGAPGPTEANGAEGDEGSWIDPNG